jgi:hypothetical protein
MNIITQSIPFFVVPVSNHAEVKQSILDSIATMGIHSKIELPIESISNTDWHLSPEVKRPYSNIIKPIFRTALTEVERVLKPCKPLVFSNFWFQQYNHGDSHDWHFHGGSLISAVYYLELNGESPKTTYRCMGQEFTIEANEGDILFAPGYFEHKSKKNTGDRKTVVVCNFRPDDNY